MSTEQVQKWIEALRSGRYKQGKYKLKVDDEYCCLGVACDIHPRVEWSNNYLHWQKEVKGNVEVATCSTVPPHSVQLDCGVIDRINLPVTADGIEDYIQSTLGRHEHETIVIDIVRFLTYVNDRLHWDFNRIANWIEKYILPREQEREANARKKRASKGVG